MRPPRSDDVWRTETESNCGRTHERHRQSATGEVHATDKSERKCRSHADNESVSRWRVDACSRYCEVSVTERSQRGSGTTFQYTYDHLAQVTQDAFENGEFAPLQAAVVDAIAVCHTSDELWSLLSIEGLDEATFVEDEHPPQVAEAILARADSWGETADAASAVALLVRMSAFDPAPMLLPTMDDGVKDKVASVLDACAERLAAYLGSPCAPMRASCAHALGRCRTATMKQAKALLHLAASEVDPSARAAMLLSAGAISRRRGESVGVIDGNTSHPSQLVRGCAAAACALAGETLAHATRRSRNHLIPCCARALRSPLRLHPSPPFCLCCRTIGAKPSHRPADTIVARGDRRRRLRWSPSSILRAGTE